MFNGADTDINLHVFGSGASEIDRMLRLREWLRTNDAGCACYADAKRELAKRTWRRVPHYAEAKTAVVLEMMDRADAAFNAVALGPSGS